jgi:hypothetical protein
MQHAASITLANGRCRTPPPTISSSLLTVFWADPKNGRSHRFTYDFPIQTSAALCAAFGNQEGCNRALVSLIAATWKSNHTASRRRIEGASKVWKKNHGKASMTRWMIRGLFGRTATRYGTWLTDMARPEGVWGQGSI